ncbi:DOMON-like domain-containing protein [Sphingomonas sp. LHG3406-1]|uniref:DOMON-like domain-containing protein n=1 Tax=Sphingomonas sp. LHG3406-1 TaxID=2804617 RepID=UPI002637015F|nr:DOMON-like domain-containing protein [Sphingomonas sp. LHG3406-1]
MRFELKPHPTTVPGPAFTLWASAERSAAFGDTATLNLWYGISAPIARFLVPDPTPEPQRRDNLWRSTCFEIFLKEQEQVAYQEWNFAPSGDWAAYDFEAEREGMSLAEIAAPPYIRVEDNLTWWGLGATLSIPADARFTIALSAVVEEKDGRRSFWALHHPRPEPDFHHPDCFVARLA